MAIPDTFRNCCTYLCKDTKNVTKIYKKYPTFQETSIIHVGEEKKNAERRKKKK